ncbi:MAG: hypothetical protein KKA07_10450 [Bacteroidetes bacterium]|nr:hypothetical protein [Bacteroidota bacterium]MBU1719476.1 hypothetical protein [Bacteroidota bacterium]
MKRVFNIQIFSVSLLAVFMIVVGTGSIPPGENEAMKGFTYSAVGGMFEVVFPVQYTEEKTDGEKTQTTKVTADEDGVSYMLSLTKHSEDLSAADPMNLAKVSIEAFAEAAGGKLTKSAEVKCGKHKGMEGTVDLSENSATIAYRVFLVQNYQIQMVAVCMGSKKVSKKAMSFLKSLKIKA